MCKAPALRPAFVARQDRGLAGAGEIDEIRADLREADEWTDIGLVLVLPELVGKYFLVAGSGKYLCIQPCSFCF
jgi:hypothetical protein